ncbi:hypothetical protein [Geomobilimonas luticola]|uniref:Lipoprotein n=1 Tax=Geomobilimonas luticola TaxID=1114878 RepID=A0ABS5SCI2_9BACT|nr:hypothetical protein [Geomobilimonas luticola]MBT0653077.1 hypothetical protein [Geomobilimonas luticola]
MNKFGLVSATLALVVGLLMCGCASSPEIRTSRIHDVRLISGFNVGEWILLNGGNEAQWVITGWQLRVQNIGAMPVDHIKFRLKIWKNENKQMMYSQVHTIDIHLDPQDVLTTQKFPLKDKFWYGDKDSIIDNKVGWDAEILQVW